MLFHVFEALTLIPNTLYIGTTKHILAYSFANVITCYHAG
jgi:hypothetical protein